MTTIQQVRQQVQAVLGEQAERLGRSSGFVQRTSKMNGSVFAQTLVWGWLANPEASLSELARCAGLAGVSISAQGLDVRFTARAARFMQELVGAAMGCVIASEPLAIPLLGRFCGVYVQDSTVISLPPSLHEEWPGVGTNRQQATAALKVQVRFDYSSGLLDQLELQAARSQDRSAALQRAPLPVGSLRLADGGYFSLPVLRSYHEAGVYFLTRSMIATQVCRPGEAALSLAAFVAQHAHQGQVDEAIFLGKAAQLPARLVAWCVSADTRNRRLRQLKQQARKQQRPANPDALALAGWAVFVTNVPATLLTVAELEAMSRIRWQIELLFKLWKSHARLAHSRSHKPWRILCECLAKLLACLIQHWLFLATCWAFPDRSLPQAAATLRHFVVPLALALDCPDRFAHFIAILHFCLAHRCRINRRKAHPPTFQRLFAFP